MSEPIRNFTEDHIKAAVASGGYCILTITEADGTVHEHLACADDKLAARITEEIKQKAQEG
ncbi:MAG: hypothetical protein JXB36_02945 [Gammaproteobacteria bacterium]|nr:hypothetical protein [Gammaproteobacteria bacterium]